MRLLSGLELIRCIEPSCSTQERGPTDSWGRLPPSRSLNLQLAVVGSCVVLFKVLLQHTGTWTDRQVGESATVQVTDLALVGYYYSVVLFKALLQHTGTWTDRQVGESATVPVTDLALLGFSVVLFKVMLQCPESP